MKFFNNFLGIRIEKRLERKIEEVIELNQDRYENISQFIRCAIIQLLEKEKNKDGKN